mmetsp:Transcript_28574/g.31220  ORF Transcript_28574/g.31220 Transcript_28574/m.31220 type:complete len:129 (-) Transcript_28574:280-666(-)
MSTKIDRKRVAVVGFAPEAIDLSGFPGATPEKIRGGLDASIEQLKSLGHDAVLCLFDPNDWSTTDAVVEELRNNTIHVIEVGAGMRKSPDLLHLFERFINQILETGTKAKVCFNNDPTDTVPAILRWL